MGPIALYVVDDPILTLFKWGFLILIYLFFFRVLQVVWRGSTTRVTVAQVQASRDFRKNRPNVGRAPKAARPSTLRVLEPSEMEGTTYEVSSSLIIGRAEECDLVLEDTFISQQHAKISKNSKGLVVEDLGSTNGTFLNNQKLRGPKQAYLGDRVRLGNILMELT